MKQHKEFWLGLSLCSLLLACPAQISGQRTGCTAGEQEEALQSDTQDYRDAMALSEVLRKKGIVVNCMLGSTMDGTFEGQSGAALYRSNHGSFEVVFLPQTATFDRLKIFEQRQGGAYSYRFKGPPQPWPANLIESAYRIYFIRNQNLLFVVENDTELAATLQKFVCSQHQAALIDWMMGKIARFRRRSGLFQ